MAPELAEAPFPDMHNTLFLLYREKSGTGREYYSFFFAIVHKILKYSVSGLSSPCS